MYTWVKIMAISIQSLYQKGSECARSADLQNCANKVNTGTISCSEVLDDNCIDTYLTRNVFLPPPSPSLVTALFDYLSNSYIWFYLELEYINHFIKKKKIIEARSSKWLFNCQNIMQIGLGKSQHHGHLLLILPLFTFS